MRNDTPKLAGESWGRAYAAVRLSLRRERMGVLERNGDDPIDPLALRLERDIRVLDRLVDKARRFEALGTTDKADECDT